MPKVHSLNKNYIIDLSYDELKELYNALIKQKLIMYIKPEVLKENPNFARILADKINRITSLISEIEPFIK